MPTKKDKIIKEALKAQKVTDSHRKKNHAFILDSNKVQRLEPFVSFMIDDVTRAYGFHLPKMVDVEDKKGNVVTKEQAWKPAIVTSYRDLLEADRDFQITNNIMFKAIPEKIVLRWKLEHIDDFLKGKEIMNLPEVFEQIKNKYNEFLYFQNDLWYSIHALWDIGTYFFTLFPAYPLFELTGVHGSAKTKIMNISRRITFNGSEVMINPTEAVMFRESHALRHTKYIDEAEKLFSFNPKTKQMEGNEIIAFINASYSKGSTVPRIEKIGGRFLCVYYDAYSPVMVGSINGLYGATESRSIRHITTRAPKDDERANLDPETTKEKTWQEIRHALYVHGLTSWERVKEAYETFKENSLSARDLQIWKPVLSIAKLIDQDLAERIKDFAVRASEQRKSDYIDEGTMNYKILEAVHELIDLDARIYLKHIREKLKELNPDMELPKSNKPISSRLDKYGFAEVRGKDRNGAFFEISRDLFESIVSGICPDFSINSSHSSHSSQLHLNNNKVCDECVTNTPKDVMNNFTKCDECDENDECDERTIGRDYEKIIIKSIKSSKNPYNIDALFSMVQNQHQDLKRNHYDVLISRLKEKGIIFEVSPGMLQVV